MTTIRIDSAFRDRLLASGPVVAFVDDLGKFVGEFIASRDGDGEAPSTPNRKLLDFVRKTALERADTPTVNIGDSVKLIRALRNGGSDESP